MSDKNWIKKKLLNSSTMPAGTGGSAPGQWMMGSASSAHAHDHHHHADGSCCGHDHSHSHDHHHDHDEDEDCTSPKGGCC